MKFCLQIQTTSSYTNALTIKMDNEFLIHLLSQRETGVCEIVLFIAIQIMANKQFFSVPTQSVVNNHTIYIAIFVIFFFYFSW